MDWKWSKVPKQLNKVWIGVSGERKPRGYSKAIELYQKTNYSHTFAMFWSRDSKDFVITNSHGKAVQLDTPEQFNKTSIIRHLWEIDLNDHDRIAFIKRMVELDGTPYSPWYQMAWLVIARYFKFKWSPFADKNDSFWCSEYADEMLKSVGLPTTYQMLSMGRNAVAPIDNVKALRIQAKKQKDVSEVVF